MLIIIRPKRIVIIITTPTTTISTTTPIDNPHHYPNPTLSYSTSISLSHIKPTSHKRLNHSLINKKTNSINDLNLSKCKFKTLSIKSKSYSKNKLISPIQPYSISYETLKLWQILCGNINLLNIYPIRIVYNYPMY